MKKKIAWMLFLLLILIINPAFSKDDEEVYYVAGDIHFPPYEYLDSDGVYRGFNVDLMKAISLVTGMEFVFKPMMWEDAFHSIERGQADIIQGMKESESRKSKFSFTDSLMLNSQSIFVKTHTFSINVNSDLAGKKVSVLKEDIVYFELSKINDIVLVEYNTIEEAVEALLNEDVDAMVGNTLTVNYICNEEGWIDEVKIVGDTLNEQKYALAVSKDNPQLLKRLNDGLKEIQKNGMYDALHRKWFGTPIKNINEEKMAQLRIMLIFSLALVLILLGARFFNRKLKAIIEEKTREEKLLINELRNYDKLQFMDRIISSLAHEIRNPLTSVKLYTTQMHTKIDNPDFMLAAARDIPEEITRIDDLIKEFMEYTTPRTPHIKILNLKHEIENAIKFIKLQIKDIRVDVDIPNDMEIAFDHGHFKQLVINIVLNSKDALIGVESPHLNIRGYYEEAWVNIEFSDNGCGMDTAALSYIFEPFFTTKDNGNGVGMFIVKKLVEENGGTIVARNNTTTQGLSVTLSLQRGMKDET